MVESKINKYKRTNFNQNLKILDYPVVKRYLDYLVCIRELGLDDPNNVNPSYKHADKSLDNIIKSHLKYIADKKIKTSVYNRTTKKTTEFIDEFGGKFLEGAKTLEELPQRARDYIRKIEEVVGAPIDIISTGPERMETIVLRHPFEG